MVIPVVFECDDAPFLALVDVEPDLRVTVWELIGFERAGGGYSQRSSWDLGRIEDRESSRNEELELQSQLGESLEGGGQAVVGRGFVGEELGPVGTGPGLLGVGEQPGFPVGTVGEDRGPGERTRGPIERKTGEIVGAWGTEPENGILRCERGISVLAAG
jgi:hypothetical protein